MSIWHEHSLVDAHRADLRRQTNQRRLATACRSADAARRGAPVARVQHRLGLLLVEAGLHLITRTGNRGVSRV